MKLYNLFKDPNKELVRNNLIDGSKKNAKVAIFLPGRDMFCVKRALEVGTINKKTNIILVERDENVCQSIKNGADELGIDYHIHNGELHTLSLDNFGLVDFAFLDLCGQITPEIARWLILGHPAQKKGAPFLVFNYDSKVIFTCSTKIRHNEFHCHLKKNLPNYFKDQFTKLSIPIKRDRVVDNISLAKMCLNRYSHKLDKFYLYKNTHSRNKMVSFGFSVLGCKSFRKKIYFNVQSYFHKRKNENVSFRNVEASKAYVGRKEGGSCPSSKEGRSSFDSLAARVGVEFCQP